MSSAHRHRERLLMFILLLYGCVAAVNGQDGEQSSSSGLQSADVAAIILGVVLFLLLVLTAIICFKKVCVKEEPDEARVYPVIMGFSTSPQQLKCTTDWAIEKENINRQKQRGGGKQPIIYMYDDIYHPPKSRPLPSDHNGAIPNGYPAAPKHARRPRYQSSERTKKVPDTPRSRSADHGERASQASSRTVSVNGHLLFPDKSRMNFITHFEESEA